MDRTKFIVCQNCEQSKPASEFSKNRSRESGLQSYCKPCMKDAVRFHYKRFPWMRHYKSAKERCENPSATTYWKYGARGIGFELTKLEIEILWKRDYAEDLEFPSLDRLDSKGNYSYENCQFIEHRVNSAKREGAAWKKSRQSTEQRL